MPKDSGSANNGGKTGYYDLPRPDSRKVRAILEDFGKGMLGISEAATAVYEAFPQTLNDLIEFKGMLFWRGDAFKALYAIEERAAKGGASSEERELNKVIYYCNRRLAMLRRAPDALEI
jgi:hypothetical protein